MSNLGKNTEFQVLIADEAKTIMKKPCNIAGINMLNSKNLHSTFVSTLSHLANNADNSTSAFWCSLVENEGCLKKSRTNGHFINSYKHIYDSLQNIGITAEH